MKNLLRISIFSFLFSYFALHLFGDFFLKNNYLGALLVVCGAATGIFFVVSMFVFWFRRKFKNVFWKAIWLFVLLFTYFFIGPIIFYIVVYEMKKTLITNDGTPSCAMKVQP